MKLFAALSVASVFLPLPLVFAPNTMAQNAEQTPRIALQPLAQQIRQVQEALSFLGQPLLGADAQRINTAMAEADEAAAVGERARGLDASSLFMGAVQAGTVVKVV